MVSAAGLERALVMEFLEAPFAVVGGDKSRDEGTGQGRDMVRLWGLAFS